MALQSHNSLMMMINIMLVLLLTFSTISKSQTSFRPKGLVLKVTKDASTSQYLTTIPQGTPKFPAKLTLDLGGDFMWVNCETAFDSSTRRSILCRTAQCSLSTVSFCNAGEVCDQSTYNSVIGFITNGNLSTDSVSLPSTKPASRIVEIPNLIFTCTRAFLLEGLAEGSIGMAGLGRSKVSLPSLLSAAFSFPRTFSVCLTPSPQQGFVLFGENNENENIKRISETLTFTPLIQNPSKIIPRPSTEYFIGVKSIRVNGKTVPVNESILTSFDSNGHGGVKISTVRSNTVMESSIHDAVVAAFDAAFPTARGPTVAPFAACYRDTAAAVAIELVMRSDREVWRFEWSDIKVKVNETDAGDPVACLGIIDGGPLGFLSAGDRVTQAGIVIGGREIEDRFLKFDLASSRLGFSSPLRVMNTSCSNFNV